MTSSLTRSSARAESGRFESCPGVSPRESISEKKATALNAVAFFVDLPPLLQACRSPLPQRRIESAADRCCGRDRCHSGGFLLRIMPPSWHPVPACTPRLRCRRAILSCSSGEGNGVLQAKLFFFAAAKIRIGRGSRCRYGHCRRNHSSFRKRKLESDAENRCR